MSSPQLDRIRDRMAELQESLDKDMPGFAFILKDIHDNIRADPDVVTVLTDEEIAVIVKGLEKHSHIVVTPAKAKKTTKKTPISADDL
jgi:hypothetical protein